MRFESQLRIKSNSPFKIFNRDVHANTIDLHSFIVSPIAKEDAPPLAGAHVETGLKVILRVMLLTKRLVAVSVSRLVRRLFIYFGDSFEVGSEELGFMRASRTMTLSFSSRFDLSRDASIV